MSNTTFSDFNELMREVRKLGKQAAGSALARPEFIMQINVAATEGVVDNTKNKHGDGVDDATKLWDGFTQRHDREIEDVSFVGRKEGMGGEKDRTVRISEIRQVISVGARFPDDMVERMQAAKQIALALKKSGEYTGNLHDALISVVRAHKKVDAPLTDEELRTAILPKTGKQKDWTELRALEEIEKLLKRVLEGTQDKDGVPGKEAFPSEHAEQARSLISERVSLLKLQAL